MNAAMAMPSRRVDVWFTGVTQQNRWTVLIRIILLIPQLVVLVLLGIALFFVAIIGWLAALITGRLPTWAYVFMSGLVRWTTRVQAYFLLLTDRYPPFSFDDADYPVRPILPAPGELNRLAVLFRFPIALPAIVFQQIVANGLTSPLLFVNWLIVLFTGQVPQALLPAYCALIRYQARLGSYYFMIDVGVPVGHAGRCCAERALPLQSPPSSIPQAPPQMPPAVAPAPPPDQPPVTETGAPPVGPPPMPPPSEWERSVPAADDAGAGAGSGGSGWGTLIVAGAARGWMIFAIVWGAIITLVNLRGR